METAEEKTIFTLVLIGTMGFFLIVIFLILLYTRYRNSLLKEKLKAEELQLQYRLELLRSNIQTQEVERKRFSRDLHDEVGAVLSMLKMNVTQLDRSGIFPEIPKKYISSIAELATAALNSTRRISHELAPPALETFGLFHILEAQAELLRSGAMEVRIRYDDIPRLPAAIELGLYRVMMELISNTIKHSGAGNIEIDFSLVHHTLKVRYSDNGSGLKNSDVQHMKGSGMKNIESRIAILNGTVVFDQAHPAGMAVDIAVPVHDRQEH
jgi:signal transduction histidine kinase